MHQNFVRSSEQLFRTYEAQGDCALDGENLAALRSRGMEALLVSDVNMEIPKEYVAEDYATEPDPNVTDIGGYPEFPKVRASLGELPVAEALFGRSGFDAEERAGARVTVIPAGSLRGAALRGADAEPEIKIGG